MDEKTKVKMNQVIEMIFIYQSGIGELNEDERKLMITDLNMKKTQLDEFKKMLSEHLDNVYAAGANEIDEEVNQLRSQLQKIEDSLDIIADLLYEENNFAIHTDVEEPKKQEEYKIIEDTVKNEQSQIYTNVSYDSLEKELDELPDENDENNAKEILNKTIENKELNEKSIFQVNSIYDKDESKKITLSKYISESSKNIAEKIVKSREQNILNIAAAVNTSVSASNVLMGKIGKSLGIQEQTN